MHLLGVSSESWGLQPHLPPLLMHAVCTWHSIFYLCVYPGKDFNSSVCVVKFSVAQANATVCIPIYDDYLKEGNETFSVLLSVPDDTALIPGQYVIASIVIVG